MKAPTNLRRTTATPASGGQRELGVTVRPPQHDASSSTTPQVGNATTPTDTKVDRHCPYTMHNTEPRGHKWPGLRSLLSSHQPKGHSWRGWMHGPVRRTSPCQAPAPSVPNEAGWRAVRSGPCRTQHVNNPDQTAEYGEVRSAGNAREGFCHRICTLAKEEHMAKTLNTKAQDCHVLHAHWTQPMR